MKEVFTKILDKDEKIINVFKPNKLKLYVSAILSWTLILIAIYVPAISGILSEFSGVEGFTYLAIVTSVFVILEALILPFVAIYYKNLYYAYSNKRVIIRTGIIGVDYKSLDMKMIGAINVYVSPLDKIIRKNTGSITFGSMASPMMANNANGMGYKFSNIQLPYDVYREVKDVIDEFKASEK